MDDNRKDPMAGQNERTATMCTRTTLKDSLVRERDNLIERLANVQKKINLLDRASSYERQLIEELFYD